MRLLSDNELMRLRFATCRWRKLDDRHLLLVRSSGRQINIRSSYSPGWPGRRVDPSLSDTVLTAPSGVRSRKRVE